MKKKLVFFLLGLSVLLVLGAIQTIPKLSDLLFRTRYVTSVSEFTNTVNNFNTLSIDGVKRTILLSPGTYALATGTYRLHVSNNICISGSGMNQTTITGLGGAANPMIWLWDNCQIEDVKLVSSGTGANPQLGVQSSTSSQPTSTNVVVNRVWLSGDDDNLWLTTDGGAYTSVLPQFNAIEWTVNGCVFENRFDSVFIEGSAFGGDLDGDTWDESAPCQVRIFGSRLVTKGPSLNAASQARGDVSNLRVLGTTARAELYGCFLESSGGTNLTAIAFLGSGPSGADPTQRYPGGLYLNNCQVRVIGTNLAAGGVGACLLQSTNGWAFLNGVLANSNNVVGTGTNHGSVSPPRNSRIVTNEFVLNTRYTNTAQINGVVGASFTLSAAAAGTAKVSLIVEHNGRGGMNPLTNTLSISAGPLAALVTVEPLVLPITPYAAYYFTNQTSGTGASAAILNGTSSITYE